MKLKRILALAVVAVMALSSVANAAVTVHPEYGCYVQDVKPTKAQVEARAVSVTPVVEKIDFSTANTYGITAGFGPSAKNDSNTDFYRVTMTVNNIGELYKAYDPEFSGFWSVTLYNIAITIPGISNIIKGTSGNRGTTSTFEGVSWAVGGDGLQLTYGSNANTAYPASEPELGIYIANPEVSVVAVYAVNKDAVLDVTPTVKVTYPVNGLEATANAEGVGTANVVFPPIAPTTYTYTFKNIDGTADIDVQSGLAAGATVTAPTAPTVAGKVFDHWSDAVGGAAVDVDATASDNKTYFAVYVDAAPAYETVAPSTAQTAKVAEPGATTYTDYDSNPVTLSKNYAIARFQTGIDGSKNYQIHASSASTATEKDFDVNFGLLEVSGTANFVTIIKGAPADTVMELRVK